MVDTLLEFLAAALGNHLTPAGGAAWKKLLDTFIVVVGQELEKTRKDQKQCSACIINWKKVQIVNNWTALKINHCVTN